MLKRISGYFKSTFVRYMVSYVLVMILLVTSLTVYMYAYYRRSISASIEQSEINKLASVRYQNERNIKALRDIANALSGNFDASLLKRVEEQSDVCERVYAYLPESGCVLSDDGETTINEFIAALEFENANEAELYAVFTSDENAVLGAQMVTWTKSGETGAYVVFCLPMNAGERMEKMICFVPVNAFESFLNDEIYADRSRHILFNGAVIATDDGQGLGTEFSAKNSEAIVSEAQDTETMVKRIAGRDYLVITMPGNEMNLTYLTAIPTDSVYSAAASGWIGFVAILLVFAVPCIVMVVLISRLNYRTIREISARFVGDETQTDEIHVIRAGISELDKKLTSSIPERRIQFVQNLVRGHYAERAEAADTAAQLGIDVGKPYYAVMLLGAPRDGQMDVYLEKLLSAVPGDISCTGTDLLAYEQILLVAFANETHRLRDFAQKLCALDSVKAARVSVAMSDVHEAFGELPTAYLEANSAYENRFVMGEARLLNFKDISFAARTVPPQAKTYVEAVKQAIAAGDIERTNMQLDELLMFLRSADLSLFAFRQVYNDVISAIMSLRPAESEKLSSYDLFTLSNCRSIDELDRVLRKVSAGIIEEISSDDQTPLIQSILAFIAQNYTESNFSVASVAEKFALTTTRLNVEFKENMHMTTLDYITMLRMEHAKKLLRQTEHTIKDICADVGYSDVSSFIRRFKMYTGNTPLNYRQAARENAQEDIKRTDEENKDEA